MEINHELRVRNTAATNVLKMIRNISKATVTHRQGWKRRTRQMWPGLKNPHRILKTCTHSLSLMLSKVHWLSWKKAWRLMSSTPLRPSRTFLSTARKLNLSVDPPQPRSRKHTPEPQLRPPPTINMSCLKHTRALGDHEGLTNMTSMESRRNRQWTLEPGIKVSGGERERRQAGSGRRWPRQQLQRHWSTCCVFPFPKIYTHTPFFAPPPPSSEWCSSWALPHVGHSTFKKEEERAGEGRRKEREHF